MQTAALKLIVCVKSPSKSSDDAWRKKHGVFVKNRRDESRKPIMRHYQKPEYLSQNRSWEAMVLLIRNHQTLTDTTRAVLLPRRQVLLLVNSLQP
jgi:hypothetical protein